MKFEGEKQQATCMSDEKVCYFHYYGDLYSDQLVLTPPISLSLEHSENPSSWYSTIFLRARELHYSRETNPSSDKTCIHRHLQLDQNFQIFLLSSLEKKMPLGPFSEWEDFNILRGWINVKMEWDSKVPTCQS